ncbi:MAG TPA: recombination mediator RecR [Leptolyngbyaceae cyanobacterium]
MHYAPSLAELVNALTIFPGVGPRSAQKMALFLMQQPKAKSEQIATAILKARTTLGYCKTCYSMCEADICNVCSSAKRDHSTILVVPEYRDVVAILKTREYKGVFHVLGGVISPMDGVGADVLTIEALVRRVGAEEPDIKEVILGLPNELCADTTALFISQLLRPFKIPVTRIAFGLPVNGDLEAADEVTLSRAIDARQPMK